MRSDARKTLRTIRAMTGTAPDLDITQLPPDPVMMFRRWLDQALEAGVPEPQIMTLSTVDHHGLPDARVLQLRDIDHQGWAFSSQASSPKGQQLYAHPTAALSFWWQPVARAVRVRGNVIEASRDESEADLLARSPAGREGVDPEDWTLWRVEPSRVEFWQGSPDRQHKRIIYTRDGDTWHLTHAL